MKRIMATALVCAMLFSLAACSGKQQETTISESSETTAQATETTTETTEATKASETAETTTAATTAAILTKKDYVTNARSKYKSYVGGDPDKSFYVPELLIKSAYAESINNEIKKLFEGYKKELKKNKEETITGTEYFVYLTKEGILSIVFIERRYADRFHVYNIDVTTGEKVDNARMAEMAGVKSIRTAAMDLLQDEYNNTDNGYNCRFENYKIVTKKGKKLTSDQKKAQATFGEKYINDNMAVGLTDEGKMFFVLTMYDGLIYEPGVYEAGEGNLWHEGNPALVAPKDS